MNDIDEAFRRRLRATFEIEAAEHLQAIAAGLLALEQQPHAASSDEVYRRLHSLKGAARATDEGAIESLCQALEDLFERVRANAVQLAANDFDRLHQALDLIGGRLRDPTTPPAALQALLQELRQQLCASGADSAAPLDVSPAPAPLPAEAAPVVAGTGEALSGADAAVSSAAERVGSAGDAAAAAVAVASLSTHTLRVAIAPLDRVLQGAEGLLLLKQAAARRSETLRDLQRRLAGGLRRALTLPRIEPLSPGAAALPRGGSTGGFPDLPRAAVAAPRGGVSRRGLLSEADAQTTFSLLRDLQQSLRQLAQQAVQDQQTLERQIDALLAEARPLRMQPLSSLSELLPRMLRDLAREQGKQVVLQVSGGDIAIDRRVLDALKDPLLHLLRNAVDHGIERPPERLAAGKSECGQITLSARLLGTGQVEIELADDGAGIDAAALRAKAQACGLSGAAGSDSLDAAETLDLVFRAELSTRTEVSRLSGRGLGLAIAREVIERLGGRIAVHSQPGVGSCFALLLPQSLATLRGLLVRVGERRFVLPNLQVERVLRLSAQDIRSVGNRETLLLHGQPVALVQLGELLEVGHAGAGAQRCAVVLGSGDERIAFAVDELLDEAEVLVKPLPAPLIRLRHVAAVTVLASGALLPILDSGQLLRSARRAGLTPHEPASTPRRQRILLAEDSITSRLLLQGILEVAGFDVATAVDGQDALEALRAARFDMLISDVEMPRLDGLALTTRLRADHALAALPVVLITARGNSEDRQRGLEAGANAYIVKSSFEESELLATIDRLLITLMSTPINVLVVADSSLVQRLAQVIDADPRLHVMATANTGQHALTVLGCCQPDVLVVDMDMPGMDTYEALRRIMQTRPAPIVACSGQFDAALRSTTLRALEAGAVAVVGTPGGGEQGDFALLARILVDTVTVMSEVKVVRRWLPRGGVRLAPLASPAPGLGPIECVVIGASTGGPAALQRLLRALPPAFPLPILIVQHIAPGFLPGLAAWLHDSTGFAVGIAQHGEPARPAHAYLAPDEHHLLLAPTLRLGLSATPAEDGLRPAASVLFRSVARELGARVAVVLLSGMGRDGAAEMLTLHQLGAPSFAQDAASASVHGMPGEAIRLGAARQVLPPEQIARALAVLASPRGLTAESHL